jgi:hypothetical protein
MNSEKTQLAPNATSYSIEVDLEDLNLGESLSSRYERYSQEQISQNRRESTHNLPTSPASNQNTGSGPLRGQLPSR